MTWTKIDDQLHAHPKVQRAWRANEAALGLHLLALSYAGAYLTDGHISQEFVLTQIPTAAKRKKALATLIGAGLWETNGQGWLIHDYLDYNASREHMESVALARTPGGARPRGRAPARPVLTPTPYPTNAVQRPTPIS